MRNGETEGEGKRQILCESYVNPMWLLCNSYGTTRWQRATTALATRTQHAPNPQVPREAGWELELFQILTSGDAGLGSG